MSFRIDYGTSDPRKGVPMRGKITFTSRSDRFDVIMDATDLLQHYRHVGGMLLTMGETAEVDNLPVLQLIQAVIYHPASPTLAIRSEQTQSSDVRAEILIPNTGPMGAVAPTAQAALYRIVMEFAERNQ